MGWWNKLARDFIAAESEEPTPAFEFWSIFDPLNEKKLKHLWPQPASQFFPEWFKNVPRNIDNDPGKPTIRKCPVFPEFMTQGYIVPMWCDFQIAVNHDGTFRSHSAYPADEFQWVWHHPDQYLNHVPPHEQAKWCCSIKAETPWRVKTPPGWSCYVHAPLYHFNDVVPLSGSIRTDLNYEINAPVMIPEHLREQVINLKRGDPFLWLIPYKRETLPLRKREYTEEVRRETAAVHFEVMSQLHDGYKKSGRKMDEELGLKAKKD